MSTDEVLREVPALAHRLGYLLKHAQQRLHELNAEALEPYDISGRECAVLMAIDDQVPISQHAVARRLGVDRTTMVALIDALEEEALVERRRDPDDRRKNVVSLTQLGRTKMRKAVRATDAVEKRLLAGLTAREIDAFHAGLRAIAFDE